MANSITAQGKITQTMVRQQVIEVLQDVFNDPDFGLELTEKTKKRLRQALRTRERTIPLSAIKEKYF